MALAATASISETLIESMLEAIGRYQDRVIVDHIQPATRWRGSGAFPG